MSATADTTPYDDWTALREPVYTGPETGEQLAALGELERIAGRQAPAAAARLPVHARPEAAAPKAAVGGERAAGRHHASRAAGDEILRRHGARFASFAMIGGGVFAAGLLIQAALTAGLHVPSLASYIVQAVVSVEASYLLNRRLTWKGERIPLWPSFLRYNAQKAVTVTANLVLYGVLLRLGMEYLLDNVLLTVVFTFVNYIGADRLVFLRGGQQMVAAVTGPMRMITGPMPVLRLDRQPAPASRRSRRDLPSVSVVIPVRGNEATIRAAVDSILGQDYPLLREVILVGSPGDSTWAALRGLDDPRLTITETETPPGIRDANFKRDLGIRSASGEVVSLIDSDMVIPADWMSRAVRLLTENEVDCVAGVMRSINDTFWGRFVDGNRLGAKTPRAQAPYLVTAEGFGAEGYKPPITADILFTRRMYEDCPIDGNWSHGSLEDYEWFWRVVGRGHKVLVSNQLYGWHHHRAGFRKLAAEYRRSARGCAYFIRAHRRSPFAEKRMTQAIVLPLAALGLLLGVVAAAWVNRGEIAVTGLVAAALAGAAFLSAREFTRTRTLESLAYPLPALALGVSYTASLTFNLIRTAPVHAAPATARMTAPVAGAPSARRTLPRRLLHPLTLILAVQAALSLSLVWSNTAFSDEAEYLWAGHLEIAHWLHGAPLPALLNNTLSGSPAIYPPIGAVADSLGGLVGARVLSLVFMLISTALLYSAAKQTVGMSAAVFAGALWAVSEPAMRLGAFATYDALSVCLTALAVWLALRAARARHRGEIVAVAAVVLALAIADAYSGIVMVPVVVAFIFFSWASTMGLRRAAACAGWFAGAFLVVFAAVMTVTHSWAGIIYTIVLRGQSGGFSYQANTAEFVLKNIWVYSGLYLVLAAAGFATLYRTETGVRRGLLATTGIAALVVPVAQLHDLTSVSLDKHLAYGIWFAAMLCGYGCQRLTRSVAGMRPAMLAVCGVLVLAYPVANSWEAAFYKQLSWNNSTAFISALRPVITSEDGEIDASTQAFVARYYTAEGSDWNRWNSGSVPLTIGNVPAGKQTAAYGQLLQKANLGVICLFYTTTVRGLPASIVLSTQDQLTRENILNLVAGNDSSGPTQGQTALTVALEDDPSYRLVSVGPYNSNTITGIYAIWERTTSPVIAKAAKP